MLLEHKRALVTGAGGRLGREIVGVLAREGAEVAGLDLHPNEAPAAALSVVADVTDPDVVAATVERVEDELGPLDVLINAHGIFPTYRLVDVGAPEWDHVFAVNVRGCMLTCQAVTRRWLAQARPGAIVNLSSGAGSSARAGGAAYCGSKAALNMMTKVLAIELGPAGIRVNAISPGLVLDEVLERGASGAEPYVLAMLEATPLGRTGRPNDIAEMVAFLASERAAWITGEVIEVTGGSGAGRTHMPVAHDPHHER